MSKIYTKTGDQGLTGLVSGERILKCDNRIDLYGDVDELNSHIGIVVVMLQKLTFHSELKTLLKIQNSLFDLGSNLACSAENRIQYKLPQLDQVLIESIEKEIDRMDSHLPPLKKFILPGGSESGAYLHVVRTVCRRVERKLVSFREVTQEQLPEFSIEFLNRLSDYLFVLGRYLNHQQNVPETTWQGRN